MVLVDGGGAEPATDLGVPPERARLLDLNRTTLRLWEWGHEADPAVIFVHGASDHGRMWDGLAPRIAELGYRCVAIDMRGHGDSGRLTSGMMWMVAALDIALLARHLGPPVGLIGHSFGGGQVGFAAGVWPELFRWVVNLDGLGPPSSGDEEEHDWSIAEAAAGSVRQAKRVLTEAPRAYDSPEEMAERRQRINHRLPAEWTRHLVRHGSYQLDGKWYWKADPMFRWGTPGDFDEEYLEAELSMVSAPTLVVTGAEADTWSELPTATIERRLSRLQDARHVAIEGAGHYVHIEQPDAVVDEIRRFLDEVDPR